MSHLRIANDSYDNIYVNVVFNNYNSDESHYLARVNQTKTTPILDDCSKYYCSIIKFDIPLNTVPIFIMPIIPNQINPDLTPLIIGITSLGVNYAQSIIYVPDNNLSPPTQNNIIQIVTPYYYVYSFQNLINSINTALINAVAAAGIIIPANGVTPYFYLNPVTQLISLYVPDIFTTINPNQPTIFMNEYLKNYLEAFPVFFNGFNQPQGVDYVFNLSYPANNQGYSIFGVSPPNPPVNYVFTQEYQILEYWSSLRKILITSNNIPILSEITPGQFQQSVTNTLPIITDFTPSIQEGADSRSIAYYTPTSQYRLVDMISTTPLLNIDLQIFWEDKLGNINPLYISKNQQANVKIAFLKKILYKQSQLLIK